MVNANLLRYIKNKPGTPSGSITPANKSVGTKAYDALEESGLLPRWLERRNQGATKAHVAGVAKGAYDLGAQGTRDLGAIATYLGNKALGRSEEEAGANVNKYYDATKFVDKPDEALTNYAYNNATPAVAEANLKRGEREGMGMATVGALRSPVKGGKKTINLDKYQQYKKNQLDAYAKSMDLNGRLSEPYGPRYSEIPAYQQKVYSNYRNAVDGKQMDTFIQPEVRRTSTNNNILLDQGFDTDVYHMNDMISSKHPYELQRMRNATNEINADALGLETNGQPVSSEVINRFANTSKARADKLKSKNRSRAERTLLKKTERDAEQAVNDVNNLSLEKMYNQWKALNKQ